MTSSNEPTGPIPDVVVRELVKSYNSGFTLEYLVSRWPYSYRKIREALLDAGVTLRPARITLPPTPPGLVKAYIHARRSIRQLAAYYCMSYNQVRNVLLAEGVPLRNRGNQPAADGFQASLGAFDELPFARQNSTLVTQHGKGSSVRTLAEMTGLSEEAVYTRLLQSGILRTAISTPQDADHTPLRI